MKQGFLVILFTALSCVPLWAQDSLHVTTHSLTQPSSANADSLLLSADSASQGRIVIDNEGARVIQYADTFRLHEQKQALDDETEALMLALLHEQAIRLKQKQDSLQAIEDSILASDPTWLAMQDSIRALQALLAEQLRQDSIARVMAYRDSLRTVFLENRSVLSLDTQTVSVRPIRAMMPDAEEERQDYLRSLRKYSPWYKEATGMLQFSQNYVSKNWYAGGNSSFAMLGILKGFIRYDQKKWIQWENTAEWRAGINTVSGDSLRKINVSDDLFKLYTKLGVRLVKDKLYGSVTGEFQTCLFRTWETNKDKLKTGPFSPIRLSLGVGVDYKPIENMSIVFSPLAYKLVYLNDTARLNEKDFGISQGEKVLNNAGSSVRLNWKWQPLREIVLDTQFYFYTNYKMVEIDWEVNCDFIVNRYISARVSLHPRYDSSLIKEGDTKAKIQFKELISIGFAHKFH